jgi:putative endonuclease
MANSPPSHYPDIGQLGEDLVAQWLQSLGWLILHRRFSCRWGEIDVIAQYHGTLGAEENSNYGNQVVNSVSTQISTLAFVEVKTRSAGNWDAGGRSAITAKKQAKLWRTAEMFLANYPDKTDCPCRFDVAIVYCHKITKQISRETLAQKPLVSLCVPGYELQLQEYIVAAFDSVIDSP